MSERAWNTEDFLRRCHALIARGLDQRLAFDLRWCGNSALVREVESATDAQIAELNAAYAAR